TEVKPIEPVFVDYKKDMSQFEARKGIDVLYKKNESNDIFTLTYVFDTGTENDPALNLAFDYLGYLGSESLTAEQIASKMYGIACSFSMQAGPTSCRISITGLGENMAEAMEIVEGLLNRPKPDEAILANLKADMIKSRADAKLNQSRCFGALQTYMFYGSDFIRRTTLTNPALEAMSSEMLLAKIGELMDKQHKVLYYGPQSEKEVTEALAMHHKTSAELQPLDKKHLQLLPTDESKVLMAQYDAKQLYYLQYANLGKQFDVAADPEITLYNEYFGGGMNSVVFQEMREARGLAYTAQASIMQPNYADTKYGYMAFIATQNDKMQMAIEAFDEIINNMPESETAFKIAKEGLISRLRTDRTVKEQVLWSFIGLRNLGLEEDRDKQIFEKVQAMTLADVKAAQEKWVKNRKYVYGILGDIQDLDLNYLKTLGPIRTVSQEEIFGY
uniref:M16 family metallopeptidase n=1 Tax=Alistipes shahii TaxID=328814 RepID=UPI00307F9047